MSCAIQKSPAPKGRLFFHGPTLLILFTILVRCLSTIGGVAGAATSTGVCPTASILTVCFQATEPTTTKGGLPLGIPNAYIQTNFYTTIDGTAQPVVSAPATAPGGGGVVNYVLNTTTCQKHVYGFSASGVDNGPGGGEGSQATDSTVTKDRTTEAGCQVPTLPTALTTQ